MPVDLAACPRDIELERRPPADKDIVAHRTLFQLASET
jgi:hypothetical protein